MWNLAAQNLVQGAIGSTSILRMCRKTVSPLNYESSSRCWSLPWKNRQDLNSGFPEDLPKGWGGKIMDDHWSSPWRLAEAGTFHGSGITHFKNRRSSAPDWRWGYVSFQHMQTLCCTQKQSKGIAQQPNEALSHPQLSSRQWAIYDRHCAKEGGFHTCILLWWPKLCGMSHKVIISGLQLQTFSIFGEILCLHPHCGPGNIGVPLYLRSGRTWSVVYMLLSETLVYTVLVTVSQEEDIICLFLKAEQ